MRRRHLHTYMTHRKNHFINGPFFSFDIIASDIIAVQKKRVRNRGRNDARVFQFLFVQKSVHIALVQRQHLLHRNTFDEFISLCALLACVYVLCSYTFPHTHIRLYVVIVSQTTNTFTLATQQRAHLFTKSASISFYFCTLANTRNYC